MTEALIEAQKAGQLGEVPIGAVIVRDGQIIGRGHNLTRTKNDSHMPCRDGSDQTDGRLFGRLEAHRLRYVCDCRTMRHVRRRHSVGPYRESLHRHHGSQSRACGSVFNIVQEKRLNHNVNIQTGILEKECSQILKEFFRELRINRYKEKIDQRTESEDGK